MNKEELKQEAEEYAIKSYGNDAFTQAHIPQMIEPVRMYLKQAYLAGAEPREKQIQALGERCLQLQADKGRLTDENRQAKEIIRAYVDFPTSNAELWELHEKAEAFLKE